MTTSFQNGLLTFRPTGSGREVTPDAIRTGLTNCTTPLTGLAFPQVRLTEPAVRFLRDQSALVAVDRLYLNSAIATPTDLSLLLSAPIWTGLRKLEIQGLAITPETAQALAKNHAMANLRELTLWIREDGEAILAALSGSDSLLRGLAKLSLIGRGLNASGIRHLLTSRTLRSLNHLSVMLPPLDWGDLNKTVTLPLRELDIVANTGFALEREGCAALANLPWLNSLKALRIMANHHIGPEGAKALMASPYLTALEELVLAFNDIGDTGAEAIAQANCPHLRQLVLNSNDIGDAGVETLTLSAQLSLLETLLLGGNPMSDVGLAALTASPRFSHLRTLDLAGTWVTPRGALSILHSPSLRQLTSLNLQGCNLREKEELWVDQGAVIGSSPPTPEAVLLRARFGTGLLL